MSSLAMRSTEMANRTNCHQRTRGQLHRATVTLSRTSQSDVPLLCLQSAHPVLRAVDSRRRASRTIPPRNLKVHLRTQARLYVCPCDVANWAERVLRMVSVLLHRGRHLLSEQRLCSCAQVK